MTEIDRFRFDFNVGDIFDVGADLLWRDQAGDNVLWFMANNVPDFGSGSVAVLPTVTPDWHVKAAAAFAGLDSDILWQNDNGALALWKMTGSTVTAIHALPNPGPTWHVVGDNDFDDDFDDDILFQNDNGSLVIWTGINPVSGTVSGMFAGTQNPGPTWHVAATGDLGILWQNDSGGLALWEFPTFAAGSFTFLGVTALPTVDASWHVKGVQKIGFTADTTDIVFQNDNGAVVVWQMGGSLGTTILAQNLINLNPGPAWHIVGLRDMDGDTLLDLVFQNDNGAAAVWEDYQSLGGGMGTFNTVLAITPNPNPNGLVWDLL